MKHVSLVVLAFSIAFLSACTDRGTVTVNGQASSGSGDVIGVQKMQMLMPTGGELVDPVHGKEEGLAYGSVAGESGTLANGVATAHYFQDGSTIIGVQVNIADAKPGTFYDAWLMNDASGAPLDMGKLESSPTDVRHTLHFESKNNLQTYGKIIITLQQTGSGSMPGQTVASATLQTTSR